MMEELITILTEIGLPYAYHHFAEGESPAPPFICFLLPDTDNFSADSKVYFHIDQVRIELYTDKKDIAAEDMVRETLDDHGYFYQQSEVWIESEKMYEVAFTFDIKGERNG